MRVYGRHSCLLNALGQLVLKTLEGCFPSVGSGSGSLAAALAISRGRSGKRCYLFWFAELVAESALGVFQAAVDRGSGSAGIYSAGSSLQCFAAVCVAGS